MKISTRHSISKIQSSPINNATRILKHGDVLWNILITAMALAVFALLLAIGWLLWRDSADARTALGWKFLLPVQNAKWNPVTDQYQAWPFIYGTLITSLIAIIIAVPVSLGIAIFLSELCPRWLRSPLNWMVELLAAVPSVIYGIWGIFAFLPLVITPLGNILDNSLAKIPAIGLFFTGPIPANGASRLAAGLILTIMILPTVAAVSRDVFQAIPQSQREAALALGATQWETIWQVLIPYGLSGILGAVILGLGRALGETMAVTMVIGNSLEGTLSLLRPGYTMASVIPNKFGEAEGLHIDALLEIGLILFIITLILNLISRFLIWRVARRVPQV